ncbi:hypothetical protein HZC31_05420 [Candidatus Woesearchaeota archaeon]|nr:hypothetical protein [Candidatus Woesearchaeota archaeon]
MKSVLRIGLETELFLINNKGKIANEADVVLKELHKKQSMKEHIVQECSHDMIEIKAPPHEFVTKTALLLLQNMEKVQETAEKHHLSLLPLATYPGKMTPLMRTDKKYKIKSELFGEKRFLIAGRCVGFHCHYELPFNLPLVKNISLLQFLDLKHEHALLNGYNTMIAMDPALTTFMQSSPFYQGKHLAKDSRMLVYRGSPALKCAQSLYHHYEEFGQLPGYKHSIFEVIEMIEEKYHDWKKNILEVGMNIRTLSHYGSFLDTAWNPVKINKLGTLEQRGMDMNYPAHFIAAAALIKATVKRVSDENLEIVPSDVGIKKPFTVEDEKLFVPPERFIHKTLQVHSAYEGIENKYMQTYCKAVLKFAEKDMKRKNRRILRPFARTLAEQKTLSDEILLYAKKKGWEKGTELRQKTAEEIAVHYAERLKKEIPISLKQIA